MVPAGKRLICAINCDVAVAEHSSFNLRVLGFEDRLGKIEGIVSDHTSLHPVVKLDVKVALRVVYPDYRNHEWIHLPYLILVEACRADWIVSEAFLARVRPIDPNLDVAGWIIFRVGSPQIRDSHGQVVLSFQAQFVGEEDDFCLLGQSLVVGSVRVIDRELRIVDSEDGEEKIDTDGNLRIPLSQSHVEAALLEPILSAVEEKSHRRIANLILILGHQVVQDQQRSAIDGFIGNRE